MQGKAVVDHSNLFTQLQYFFLPPQFSSGVSNWKRTKIIIKPQLVPALIEDSWNSITPHKKIFKLNIIWNKNEITRFNVRFVIFLAGIHTVLVLFDAKECVISYSMHLSYQRCEKWILLYTLFALRTLFFFSFFALFTTYSNVMKKLYSFNTAFFHYCASSFDTNLHNFFLSQ